MPYHLAVRAAVRCADLPVLVAPPITFGVAHYKMGEPGTISLRLETFLALLCDVARSIWKNGFRRIILLNGHGGNIHPIGAAAVKLSEEDVWTIPLTYWQMVPDELAAWSEADAGSIGHAGEWETSLQLALRPELIDMSRAVGDMWETYFRPEVAAFARYPERRRVTASGVIGDATGDRLRKASACWRCSTNGWTRSAAIFMRPILRDTGSAAVIAHSYYPARRARTPRHPPAARWLTRQNRARPGDPPRRRRGPATGGSSV